MATGSPRRTLVEAGLVAVAAAVVLYVAYGPTYVNYDAQYALLWARDVVVEGSRPEYEAPFAPTPHPLATAVSGVLLVFGDQADMAMLWLVLLCFGALAYVAYRLGARLFHPWVGVVAALVVLTRPAIQRDALLAYQDVPFALLVAGAVLVEARRPRAGVPVLALLLLAGLLRPEAWVLAGLYWLYLWPAQDGRRRALTAGLVAAAPVLWALTDWLATGDLLHSLNGTSALAEVNERRRTPGEVPRWTVEYFGYALREPLVIGVPVGLAFAWLHARRAAALPLAVVVAMVAVFAVSPFFGLPLIRRYVDTPAVLLTLFYGLAVCGWLLLPRGSRARRGWLVAGVLAAALSVAYLPWHARELAAIEANFDRDGAMYADLQVAAAAAPVREAFAACAPLSAGDHRPVPFLRYWLGGAPGSVTTPERGAAPLGRVLVLPRRGFTTSRIYTRREFPRVRPPAGWEEIYANRSWRVWAEPGCVTRPPS